jgi:ribosome-binding protein aMBF1 (putative translation factor)
MDYGYAVRTARERIGMSKRRLALDCDLDPIYITHIESGKKVPSLEVLETLACALHVRPSKLVAMAEGA